MSDNNSHESFIDLFSCPWPEQPQQQLPTLKNGTAQEMKLLTTIPQPPGEVARKQLWGVTSSPHHTYYEKAHSPERLERLLFNGCCARKC